MDANPAYPLLLLYKNDPIYSLCASDLMTASQSVNNNFIKDQKQLAKTLKRLEHQKVTRLRQLDEEKKQFAFLMKKKLSPRGAGCSASSLVGTEGSSASTLSGLSQFSAGVGSRGASLYSQYLQNSKQNGRMHTKSL